VSAESRTSHEGSGPFRRPAPTSACLTHSRTAVSVRSKSQATCPIERSPRLQGLDDLRLELRCERTTGAGAFFFATVSMMGILSGASRLMVVSVKPGQAHTRPDYESAVCDVSLRRAAPGRPPVSTLLSARVNAAIEDHWRSWKFGPIGPWHNLAIRLDP
jgi:hypothetical protein